MNGENEGPTVRDGESGVSNEMDGLILCSSRLGFLALSSHHSPVLRLVTPFVPSFLGPRPTHHTTGFPASRCRPSTSLAPRPPASPPLTPPSLPRYASVTLLAGLRPLSSPRGGGSSAYGVNRPRPSASPLHSLRSFRRVGGPCGRRMERVMRWNGGGNRQETDDIHRETSGTGEMRGGFLAPLSLVILSHILV